MHSVRIVYDAWVAADAPEPRVVEVDGSTVDARWLPRRGRRVRRRPDRADGARGARARTGPPSGQRLAAYALAVRDDAVLLTRHSPRGPRPGTWSLPGGGLDHGEPPAVAVAREVAEETGLVATIGKLLGVHDEHFTGTAPHGREEDFHGVHLVFAAEVERRGAAGARHRRHRPMRSRGSRWPRSISGAVPVSTLVTAALAMRRGSLDWPA